MINGYTSNQHRAATYRQTTVNFVLKGLFVVGEDAALASLLDCLQIVLAAEFTAWRCLSCRLLASLCAQQTIIFILVYLNFISPAVFMSRVLLLYYCDARAFFMWRRSRNDDDDTKHLTLFDISTLHNWGLNYVSSYHSAGSCFYPVFVICLPIFLCM